MGDDAALFLAWREGDATAGHTLVARHFAAVSRFFANKLAIVEGRHRMRDSGFRLHASAMVTSRGAEGMDMHEQPEVVPKPLHEHQHGGRRRAIAM